MALNLVQANNVLTAGLKADFAHTYEETLVSSIENVRQVMELGMGATARTTPLGYFQSAPYPEYWPYGEDISEDENDSVGYNVTIRRWAKRIKWLRDDVTDDQTRTLKQRAIRLGENFGTLHERVLFQLLQSTTDAALLPAIPNAPDGVGVFSATNAASAARFGATGGNLLTGNGVADTASIVRDYYLAIQQFGTFTDTKGQPLFDPGIADRGVMVIHGIGNREIFDRAFHGTIQQGIAAGISSPLQDTSKNFKLWPTQRITDNDWYIALTGSRLKPFAQYEIEGLETTEADWSNSDEARTQDVGYFQAKARYGYIPNLPYGILQINN
ncbi:hypothetical protein [uncultured Mediterranean phage]|nr:hypothetical protein [uncultured Mediterranean phage]